MVELEMRAQGSVLATPDPVQAEERLPPRHVPAHRPGEPPCAAPGAPPGAPPHPAIFVDPRPWTLQAARSLRACGAPLVALSSRRFEPVLHARGVRRHHLPPLAARPERWEAVLLELAARLEPRAAISACTPAAVDFLRRSRRLLEPHYTLANLQAFEHPAGSIAPDAALRQALLRGEAALEVQVVLDRTGRRSGMCVLAWAAGAPPDVLVTSVEGAEVAARSEDWLGARRYIGYARLVWSPDRFGRLALQAASPLPGPGLGLAAEDGVDLAALGHAAVTGVPMPPQRARCQFVRRAALLDLDSCSEDSPLVDLPVRLELRDPLPCLAAFLRGFVRA